MTAKIKPLLVPAQLQERIAELGAEITRDYRDKDLVCVGVLKGCFPFLADLVRQIDLPMRVDFLGVSSYGNDTMSSGVVRLTSDLSKAVEDLDVLIVEDIVDTGLTIQYLLDNLSTRRPKSIAICTLLHKPSATMIKVDLDYIGFEIPNLFVVGYGLDYAELYRNVPYIGVLENDE